MSDLRRGLWARLWTRAQEWLLRGWSSTATFKGRRTGFWSSSSLTPAGHKITDSATIYEKPKTCKLNYALSLNQPRQNEKAVINLSGIHSQIYIQQWQETVFFYPWLKQIFSVSVMSGCYWAEGLMTAGQNSHLLHPPHFAPKVTMETPPAHLMPWFL